MNAFRQFFFIPKPLVTEQNCPDQLHRVHIVTGGYTGCGFELAKILYQHNATLYLAGRSEDKANKAVEALKASYPDSKGSVQTLILDLADLATIKPAVEKFTEQEQALHVLTLNAGVMTPPKGSKSAQGIDLQLATNCLGSYLLYKLLRPQLQATAEGVKPGSVRVTWAGSIVIELAAPRAGGITFPEGSDEPKTLDLNPQYAQSKCGNLLLAAFMAREDAEKGIMHLCWNPGNLKTELSRHLPSFQKAALSPILYPAIYGAYTELWAGVGEVPIQKSGSFVQPWGRLGPVRSDIQKSCVTEAEGGNGVGERFIRWCEEATSLYV